MHKRVAVLSKAAMILAFCAVSMAPAAPALADEIFAKGEFSGQSGHVAKGGVSVRKTSSGTVVVLAPDFNFDGAPDPKLGFGKNGYDASTQFSALRSNKGEQSYEIPATVDPGDYNEVWVWCEKYAVPLGVATLKAE